MSTTITIDDIAREAGVSKSTVSRVLNRPSSVTTDKQAVVLEVMKKLRYHPNPTAQRLARGKTGAIGILTEDLASPFFGGILKGIDAGLSESLYQPLIATHSRHLHHDINGMTAPIERRVDGLIVVGAILTDARLRQIAERVPVLGVCRSIVGLERQCMRVQNREGAYRATRYLIELGHRQIAHVTGVSGHPDTMARRDGYLLALNDAGIPVDQRLLVEGDFAEQSGILAVETLLARGVSFSAIFLANDQMAYGANLALFRRGIRVPDDVSLLGFDDQPGSIYAAPPLTTVRQPTREMGIAAAQAMVAMLNGEQVSLPTLETELVIRESVKLRHAIP